MKLSSFFKTSLLATAYVSSSAIANTMPQWFLDAEAREEKVTSANNKLVIQELNISEPILGKFELVEKGEGYWYFQSKLKSENVAPIDCYVLTDNDEAANTLYTVISDELDYYVKAFGATITHRSTYSLNVDTFDRTPYIALDTLYSIGEGNQTQLGVVKAIAAQTADLLGICVQNDVGFKETFSSIAESFITALDKSDNSQPFFESVHRMTVNGTPVGFSSERYSLDADGDVLIQEQNSMMLPMSATSLSRSDSISTEWSYTDGALINKSRYSVQNGEEKYNLSLWGSDGKWLVEGKFQGKKVNETLAHDSWILSSFGGYLADQTLLLSQERSREYNMWLAAANPAAITKVKRSKITNTSKANLQVDMGPMTLKYLSDENGHIEHGSMKHGPVSVQLDIMYVNGSPLLQ